MATAVSFVQQRRRRSGAFSPCRKARESWRRRCDDHAPAIHPPPARAAPCPRQHPLRPHAPRASHPRRLFQHRRIRRDGARIEQRRQLKRRVRAHPDAHPGACAHAGRDCPDARSHPRRPPTRAAHACLPASADTAARSYCDPRSQRRLWHLLPLQPLALHLRLLPERLPANGRCANRSAVLRSLQLQHQLLREQRRRRAMRRRHLHAHQRHRQRQQYLPYRRHASPAAVLSSIRSDLPAAALIAASALIPIPRLLTSAASRRLPTDAGGGALLCQRTRLSSPCLMVFSQLLWIRR